MNLSSRIVESEFTEPECRELEKLIRTNRAREVAEWKDGDQKRFGVLVIRMRYFVCCLAWHETRDIATAYALVETAIKQFYQKIGGVPGQPLLDRLETLITWRLQTRRSWLYRKMLESDRDDARRAIQGSEPHPEVKLMFECLQKNPGPTFGTEGCALKAKWRPPKLIKRGHCRLSCDLGFLKDTMRFSFRELGYIFEIGKATAENRHFECMQRAKSA